MGSGHEECQSREGRIMMPIDRNVEFTEEQLWDKCLDITREMLKFLKQEDIDMFLELVDQRGRIIEMMKAIPEPKFCHTPECEAIRNQIKPLDMQIGYKARTWLNKSKRNNMAVRSYDMMAFNPAGNVFNKEY